MLVSEVSSQNILIDYERLYLFENWFQFFGNDHPLKIEIGCGKDDSLVERAVHEPQSNFVGVESDVGIAYRLEKKVKRSKATNLKILLFQAEYALNRFFEEETIQDFFIQFPDPWPKKRHAKRRIFQKEFITLLQSKLVSKGGLFIATDVKDMADLAIQVIQEVGGFESLDCNGQKPFPFFTLYEKKFLKLGLPIYYLKYQKQS